MEYSIVLISIIIKKEGKKILLIKRKRDPGKGKWSLAGGIGALEKYPDPNEAVKHEVKNDFGREFLDFSLEAVKYFDNPEPTLGFYFVGRLNGEPQIRGVNSIAELRWFTIDEALATDLAFNQDKEVLRQI